MLCDDVVTWLGRHIPASRVTAWPRRTTHAHTCSNMLHVQSLSTPGHDPMNEMHLSIAQKQCRTGPFVVFEPSDWLSRLPLPKNHDNDWTCKVTVRRRDMRLILRQICAHDICGRRVCLARACPDGSHGHGRFCGRDPRLNRSHDDRTANYTPSHRKPTTCPPDDARIVAEWVS